MNYHDLCNLLQEGNALILIPHRVRQLDARIVTRKAMMQSAAATASNTVPVHEPIQDVGNQDEIGRPKVLYGDQTGIAQRLHHLRKLCRHKRWHAQSTESPSGCDNHWQTQNPDPLQHI
jgi:hypothetical protein